MRQIHANTVAEAKECAKRCSIQNPGQYITITSCFGLFLNIAKRLHVFAPSDAPAAFKCYWLNGVEKPFTTAQKINDQINTPQMA